MCVCVSECQSTRGEFLSYIVQLFISKLMHSFLTGHTYWIWS